MGAPVRIWYVAAACSVLGATLLLSMQDANPEVVAKPAPPLSPRRKENVGLSRETLHRSAHPARDVEQGCPEASNQKVACLQAGASDADSAQEAKPVPAIPAFPVEVKLSQPSSGDSEAFCLKAETPSSASPALPTVPCFPS